jgi:putative redox protein
MVTIRATYDGELRCTATHPSGTTLCTDAPKDNQGKGESFSPTDLVATALMSCATTIIAIVARNDGIQIDSMDAVVSKEMTADPRRIAGAPVDITIVGSLTDEQKQKLEHAARHCPVAMSLRADLDDTMRFHYEARG